MPDLPGLLCTAEDEIIILCPVILPAKPSCLLQNTPFHNKKMTNIIIGPQKIRIEIRFQMGLEMFQILSSYFIFVRIEHFCIRLFL